jgi:hypothetical protein
MNTWDWRVGPFPIPFKKPKLHSSGAPSRTLNRVPTDLRRLLCRLPVALIPTLPAVHEGLKNQYRRHLIHHLAAAFD